MTCIEYEINVEGLDPAPQGSKIRTRFGMREACKRVKPWKAAVQAAAKKLRQPTIQSACKVLIEFRMSRPKSHFTAAGHRSSTYKEHYTIKRNDIDKCIRSTLDGLTGVAYEDDCQVVCLIVDQRYCYKGEPPGAYVSIREMHVL